MSRKKSSHPTLMGIALGIAAIVFFGGSINSSGQGVSDSGVPFLSELFAEGGALDDLGSEAGSGPAKYDIDHPEVSNPTQTHDLLEQLAVKQPMDASNYRRAEFGDGWNDPAHACDTRNRILARDLVDITVDDDGCKVLAGTLHGAYTGKTIPFVRGEGTSAAVQIDHMVAANQAWQTGAQNLSFEQRVAFFNDPLNLQAVDGSANQSKGAKDASQWLPPMEAYHCEYVTRQIQVKHKYGLFVTPWEKSGLLAGLAKC